MRIRTWAHDLVDGKEAMMVALDLTRKTEAGIPDNNIIMGFASNIPVEHHGPLMLAFEREARRVTGLRIGVFKRAVGDDSKLRAAMTPEQRAKL